MQLISSEIDGEFQGWYQFRYPKTVTLGDIINLDFLDSRISWFVSQAMVVVGCRLDGWLIDDTMSSVPYNSITRNIRG